jgi:hypothetical protein
MAKYDSAINSPAAAAGAAFSNIWTPAARSARVLAIEVVCTAATASDIGVARSTARGTQTTTQVGQALDPLSGASTVQRVLLNAAGQGMIWRWDDTDPLVVSAAAGLALVCRNASVAAAVCSISKEWDEG